MKYILPKVAPVCANKQREVMGASKHETMMINCQVDAYPPANSFHWTFNSSAKPSDELPTTLHSSEVIIRLRSNNILLQVSITWQLSLLLIHPLDPTWQNGLPHLNYTPSSDVDYGTVSCWARNAVNVQLNPCVFQVVAAGTSVLEITTDYNSLTSSFAVLFPSQGAHHLWRTA